MEEGTHLSPGIGGKNTGNHWSLNSKPVEGRSEKSWPVPMQRPNKQQHTEISHQKSSAPDSEGRSEWISPWFIYLSFCNVQELKFRSLSMAYISSHPNGAWNV